MADPEPVRPPRVWRCGRFELVLDRPLVMGILNVTPDSFSDGGQHENPASAVTWGERLIADGAAILDIGGESTRPGASPLPPSGELARVRPVVRRFAADDDVPVSIDTRNAEVASACVEAGASIINDVSGFRSREMVEVAAGCEAGLVVMHMLGEPGTMQDAAGATTMSSPRSAATCSPRRPCSRRPASRASGSRSTRASASARRSSTTSRCCRRCRSWPRSATPWSLGVSRKRFIGELTGVDEPSERVGGSVEAAVWAAARGADIVRVHDVGATVQALAMVKALG